jgi:hypothetical protein
MGIKRLMVIAVAALPVWLLAGCSYFVYHASPEQADDMRTKALAGDLDAQRALSHWGDRNHLANTISYYDTPEGRLYWSCRAANGGEPLLQALWGDLIWAIDPVAGQVWRGVAARNGNAVAETTFIQGNSELTPAQLEEVNRRVGAWKPDPESCSSPETQKLIRGLCAKTPYCRR